MSVLLASDFVPVTPLYFYTAEVCIFIIPYTTKNNVFHNIGIVPILTMLNWDPHKIWVYADFGYLL